jgi:ribosomal protein S18 acetylase RimI-like enzyme
MLDVRRAASADVDAIAPLFDAYRRFYGQAPDLEGARAFVGDRLARGESVVLLATLDGEAAGFVQLYPSFSSVAMRRQWILNDLFVTQPARRRGVGLALMRAAEALAREDGARGISLGTMKANRKAKALYEKVGYQMDVDFDYYLLSL